MRRNLTTLPGLAPGANLTTMTMTYTITGLTEQVTASGKKQLGYVTEQKHEDGSPVEVYPFYQNIVQPGFVGRTLIIEYSDGRTIERVV